MFNFFSSSIDTPSKNGVAHYLNNAADHLTSVGSHLAQASVHAIGAAFCGSIVYAGGLLATSALSASASPLASYVLASEVSDVGLAVASLATDSSITYGALGLSVGVQVAASVAEPLITETGNTIYHTACATKDLCHAGYDLLQAVEAGIEYAGQCVIGASSYALCYDSCEAA